MGDPLYQWKEDEQNVIRVEENNIIQNDEIQIENNDIAENEAPLEKKRNVVKRNMPEGISSISKRQSLIRDGKYSFFDSKGNAHDAKRTTPSSKYMKPVLQSLKAIDDRLALPCDVAEAENIRNSFLDACIACENYLDNRNPWTDEGKARKQMVRDFYAQIKHESMMFENRIKQLKQEGQEPDQGATWLDVLREVRTVKYTDGEGGVKISKTGASASDVYVINKNGKKMFFKQNEKIEKKSFSTLVDEHIDNIAKTTTEYEKAHNLENEKDDIRNKCVRRTELLKTFKKIMKLLFKNKENIIERYLSTSKIKPEMIYKELLSTNVISEEANPFIAVYNEYRKLNEELIDTEHTAAQALSNDSSEEKSKEMQALIKQKEKEIEDSDYVFFLSELKELKRVLFSDSYATKTARIDVNEELSKRNVATSRMAKILGIENIVAKSEMAVVTINGKTMTGIIMDEAEGSPAAGMLSIAKNSNKKCSYSPSGFKEILSLQVFDVICGQCDRHGGNFFCELEHGPDSVTLQNFTGIDNDMSFGNLKYEDIVMRGENGLNRLRNIELYGNMSIPFIDYDLAMRIKGLDVSLIDYQMADILSKKERLALIDRIKGVKKLINKQLSAEKKLLQKGKKFISKFVNTKNNQDAWANAYEHYTKELDEIKEKRGRRFVVKYMDQTSYLRPVML